MAKITYIKWKDADFKWNDNPHTWDDVLLVKSLVESDGAGPDEIVWNVNNELDPDKKKRFIRLVCKVKGIETYSGQKTIKTEDIEVSAEDVKLVVKEVLGIDLTVENIHV